MNSTPQETPIAALPKAELHLHLEGSISPATAVAIAARHGVSFSAEEVISRYSYRDFAGFLEAFKWVTSYLREPADYELITEELAKELVRQNVVYAEVTVSAGIMLRRQQEIEANFAAICEAAQRARARGLHLQWIFDATRQFGAAAAMEVSRRAVQLQAGGIVALGMGGDELSFPASDFRGVYDMARGQGLRTVAHAGEVGGPDSIRDAIEILGAERIGHGIAAIRDPKLMDLLAERRIPLENCPTSNVCTGALARQLGKAEASVDEHPLAEFTRRGVRVVLSTDDPAMFHTRLLAEYEIATRLGLSPRDVARLARTSFEVSFLPPEEKRSFLQAFDAQAASLGLM